MDINKIIEKNKLVMNGSGWAVRPAGSLTPQDAKEIRREYENLVIETRRDIAQFKIRMRKKYKTTRAAIDHLLAGRTFKGV